jgi:hypothetical protein
LEKLPRDIVRRDPCGTKLSGIDFGNGAGFRFSLCVGSAIDSVGPLSGVDGSEALEFVSSSAGVLPGTMNTGNKAGTVARRGLLTAAAKSKVGTSPKVLLTKSEA